MFFIFMKQVQLLPQRSVYPRLASTSAENMKIQADEEDGGAARTLFDIRLLSSCCSEYDTDDSISDDWDNFTLL